ncbi:MAG: ImmA/IrrE family metallo-endopeptidase [Thermincolia bacterium]
MTVSRAELESMVFLKGRNITNFPVNIEEAASKLRVGKPVIIAYINDLPDQIGGYTRVSSHSYHIIINDNHPLQRKRFSAAHEIGHLYLGHDEVSVHRWSECCEYQELEANEFAAGLLMPAPKMHWLASYHGRDVPKLLEKVQDFFGVSLSAAAQRITRMELFKGAIVLKDGYRTYFNYLSPNFNEGSEHFEPYKKVLPSKKVLYIIVAETYIQVG